MPTLLHALSMVVLLGAVGYVFLVPKADVPAEMRKIRNQTQTSRLDAKKAKDLIALAEANARALAWSDGADRIAPKALAVVTREARARDVRLVAFRPQRTIPGSPLTQVPFVLTLEGSYPKVLDFVAAMERPSNRLAVSLLQVASSDDATSRVTASLGLTAFVRTEAEGG